MCCTEEHTLVKCNEMLIEMQLINDGAPRKPHIKGRG